MKPITVSAAALAACVLWQGQAAAWMSANRFGGSTEHEWGEGTEHTNAFGGSTEHAWGGGTEHTNAYGGTTYGAYGQGVTHTYASGASVYHPPGYAGYAGYPAYHPPVAVPYYSGNGCYGCAAAAGAVVGATAGVVAGAAIAGAAAPPPVYAPSYAPVVYATLPPGCAYQPGPQEYFCGGTWFAPGYGANGVYYRVVAAP
jgi:hypothetical protein